MVPKIVKRTGTLNRHLRVFFLIIYSTHIAAIKTTGNVFSYEAIEELNMKTKNFKDLLTDEPYLKKDMIILQDPKLTDKFNLNNFHHVKHSLKLDDDGKINIYTHHTA